MSDAAPNDIVFRAPNGSSYTTGPILGAQCAYDPYKLLKTQTQWYAKNPNNNTWPLERTESYGYGGICPLLRGACETEPLAEANRGCVKRAAPVRWHNTPPFSRLLPLPTGACRLETSTEGSGWHGQVARDQTRRRAWQNS